MVAALAYFLLLGTPQTGIERDAYGVPHVTGTSVEAAFRSAGYAVAEDRMWQMENSRRLARGRMAEVFGKSFVASDRDVLTTFYTDAELQAQFDALPEDAKSILTSYAQGVNDFIAAGKLPPGYAENGFQPEPWSVLDSTAICVRLFQLFGRGGAGEIRNLAMIGYLQTQEKTKDRFLDVFDDFAWQNDPEALTTVSREDDPLSRHKPAFPAPTREDTVKQLESIPKLSLFELLPGIRLASNETSREAAALVGAPSKVGSYAIVVAPKRSTSGKAMLLSGPQMGFQTPSVLHEMSIVAPGVSVTGADVPGVPGVVIGATPDLAWGLTSGVADTDDIFWFPTAGDGSYLYGSQTKEVEQIARTMKVKGEADVTVTQKRTMFGPIVVSSKAALFARRSSYWGMEMQSYRAITGLMRAKSADEAEAAATQANMSFNFFYATSKGDIGYRYLGRIPQRGLNLDPRLPTMATPENDWKGFYSYDQMPRVRNPKAGLIFNWNNKPVEWWPNFDTPVWGRIFRNDALAQQLKGDKLSVGDLERAVSNISQLDPTYRFFKKYLPKKQGIAAAELAAFDGMAVSGSAGAAIYKELFNALRENIFLGTTGNFISMDNFKLIAQPSVMLNALERRTKVDYLAGRKAKDLAEASFKTALEALAVKNGPEVGKWGYKPGAIPFKGVDPVVYSDRGTYIQIVEVGSDVVGRNVLPPGVAEAGAHALDQVPLARLWDYKPMRIRARG